MIPLVPGMDRSPPCLTARTTHPADGRSPAPLVRCPRGGRAGPPPQAPRRRDAENAPLLTTRTYLSPPRRAVAFRLHSLLTQIYSSLERVLGPRLQHPAVLTLLERFGCPAQICKAGRHPPVTLLRPKAPRLAERLVKDFFAALDEQTVPGTETRPR